MLDFRCGLLGLTATPGRTWADIDKDGEVAEFFSGNKVTLEVPSSKSHRVPDRQWLSCPASLSHTSCRARARHERA